LILIVNIGICEPFGELALKAKSRDSLPTDIAAKLDACPKRALGGRNERRQQRAKVLVGAMPEDGRIRVGTGGSGRCRDPASDAAPSFASDQSMGRL